MRSAAGCAALGVLLLLVAGTFDAEPFYVTGAALLLLGAGAAAWIALGSSGASVTRTLGARGAGAGGGPPPSPGGGAVGGAPLKRGLGVPPAVGRPPPASAAGPLLPEP